MTRALSIALGSHFSLQFLSTSTARLYLPTNRQRNYNIAPQFPSPRQFFIFHARFQRAHRTERIPAYPSRPPSSRDRMAAVQPRGTIDILIRHRSNYNAILCGAGNARNFPCRDDKRDPGVVLSQRNANDQHYGAAVRLVWLL